MTNEAQNNNKPYNYFALALDPVHVGSGKQQLGRVDMPIIREQATKLPILPGSSICGVTRAAVAMNVGKYPQCAGKGADEEASGKHDDDKKNEKLPPHCGRPDCLVCVTFGFSQKESGFQGLASFHDAKILFFPVNSIVGTVWVTCKASLEETRIDDIPVTDNKFVNVASTLAGCLPNVGGKTFINLGWLRLEAKNGFDLSSKLTQINNFTETVLPKIAERAVLVSNALFSRIVNANLEVRTSVSIDPLTGAADGGALFTYEAVPRSTVFFFQVGIGNPKHFKVKEPGSSQKKNGSEGDTEKYPETSDAIRQTIVTPGLKQLEYLGIGGMNTRGMGRIRVWEGGAK